MTRGGCGKRRGSRKKLGDDRLTRDEKVNRLDPCGPGGVNEILALCREQPGLRTVLSRAEELADELEGVVVG